MVMGHILSQMERSMLGNSRMGKNMVKEHELSLMEESMWGNTRMIKDGTEQNTTKTETSYTGG